MEAGAPAKRITVGGVVSETFSLYGQNIGALLGSAFLIFLVVGLASAVLARSGNFFLFLLSTVVSIAGNALYTGIVVTLVQDVRDGRRNLGVGDLFSAASQFILPLIGFGILFGIGATIGFLLLFVPGLILITLWSVGAPAIVVEKTGPIDAFKRSQHLVSGNGWSVFGVLLVTLVIVFGVGIGLSLLANPIGNGEVSTWIASVISGTITAPIFALAVSVLYFDLGGGARVPEPAPVPAEPPPAG